MDNQNLLDVSSDTSSKPQSTSQANIQQQAVISEQDRHGFYNVLFNRRDVRGQFKPDPIPNDVLSRVLYAAHHAPSVGFMQPWNFIVVRSPEVKGKVYRDFTAAHAEAELMFEEGKRETYRNLKLEGILEAPINICITCDRDRTGPTVIGRTHMGEMDLYSSVCAVQNLWLAARSEGLGVGWVSILHHKVLREALKLPKRVVPIAYLCIGYTSHFYAKPELETANWLPRLPLDELVSFDSWGERATAEDEPLVAQIQRDCDFPESYR